MKSKISFTAFFLLGGLIITTAQSDKKTNIKEDTLKQLNIIDEQVNMLNSVFEMGDASENPFAGATDYLQLLEQSDLDPELKKSLKEQYELYDMSLDPSKKKELEIKFSKMLEEAKRESLINQ